MAVERRGGNETLFLYHPESFVPLAQIRDGAFHHLHTDQLGTPLEASNDSGELTWQVTYRAWGNVVTEEVVEIQQRLGYQGQYRDKETGLYYQRYRYFDPNAGRFVSADPIGLSGGLNAYQYAPNPGNWVDPFGLIATSGCCTVVIGEDQRGRVKPKVRELKKQGINARDILSEWPGRVFIPPLLPVEKNESIEDNRKWINARMDEGCHIIDIGPTGDQPKSDWYKMELEEIRRRGYMNVLKLW